MAERIDNNNTEAQLHGTHIIALTDDDVTQNRRNGLLSIPINQQRNRRAAAPRGEKWCYRIGDCSNYRCGCKRERGHCTLRYHQGRQCSLTRHTTPSATPSATQNAVIPSSQPTQDAQAQAQAPQAVTLAQMAAMQQRLQQQLTEMNAAIARAAAAMVLG
jgi:hypothetical protein